MEVGLLDLVRRHFPDPDELDRLITTLLLLGATSPEAAAESGGEAIERAIELGFVVDAGGGRYHLTPLGEAAARVALRLYPSLRAAGGAEAGSPDRALE